MRSGPRISDSVGKINNNKIGSQIGILIQDVLSPYLPLGVPPCWNIRTFEKFAFVRLLILKPNSTNSNSTTSAKTSAKRRTAPPKTPNASKTCAAKSSTSTAKSSPRAPSGNSQKIDSTPISAKTKPTKPRCPESGERI